jgi:hypothetical protein
MGNSLGMGEGIRHVYERYLNERDAQRRTG